MRCFLCLDNLFLMFLIFRSTCFHVSYHVFMSRSIFPMCCLARSACFYAYLHVYLSFLHALCFLLCFPMLCSSFCSMSMLGSHAHMLTCCVGYTLLGSMCLYVYIHAIWLDRCLHMLICLDTCSSMFMC